jgi:NitT/TauT family transport system substrate-binding protein
MRRRWQRYLRLFPVWGLCLALLLACAPEHKTLRIGISPWPGYELIYLAQERGYFKQAGVDVQALEFSTLSDSRRAFEMGQLDGVAVTLSEVLEARDGSKRDLRVLRIIDRSAGADQILARKPITSLHQLQGQRIAIEPTSMGVYVLARALERQGLALQDVHPVIMAPEDMQKALQSGQVSAVVSYAPYSTQMRHQTDLHPIFSSRQMADDVLDVLAFDVSVLKAYPREIHAFERALDRALDYFQQNPQPACRIMARREGLNTQEFCQVLQNDIQMISSAEQHVYLGPHGRAASVMQDVYRILQQNKRITPQKGITDCLSPN